MIRMRMLATAGWLLGSITAVAASLLGSAYTHTVMADDGWNPFADKDRAAVRKSRKARRSAPAQNADRRPYLAPIREFDGRTSPPQPYPAPPPSYGAGTGYQPPGVAGNGAPGSVPYGAPGTYVPAPVTGSSGFAANAPGVQRGELAPVISSGGGALPDGAWQGLDASSAEQLLGPVLLPPTSPALNDLWRRIMSGTVPDPRLEAVRLAALLKAGDFEQAPRTQGATPSNPAKNLAKDVTEAKFDLATGETDQGCRRIKGAVATPAKLPKRLRGEAIVLAGYCAIIAGNPKAGSLAAELARDSGYSQPFVLGLLEAIASGGNVRAPLPQRVSLIDGLLVRQLKSPDPAMIDDMLQRADAAFLQLLAKDSDASPGLRLKTAERAAAINVITPAVLAEAYRAAGDGADAATGAAIDRARHFQNAERNQAQFAKTRAIRALLDSARRDGLYEVAASAVAPIVREMRPAQEISWFAETAIETLAAGADYQSARQWVQASGLRAPNGALEHWLMLLDIADPEVGRQNRGRSINVLENLARQGRLSQIMLHRLATVLDALDYNIPVPLWNMASRTEQPQTGHLPETGMLSAMKKASEARQIAATTLYALRTIAPEGTAKTHLLGLGETIRALKRAGLEKDARRLGFEVLFGEWPRAR